MTWHRPARILVGLIACGSVVLAYVATTGRPVAPAPPPVERSDPTAAIEGTGAVLQRVRAAEEQFEVKADRTLHYQDGSTRQFGVHVSVRNRSGKDFVVTADEARAGKEGKQLELSGKVSLVASDGFELTAPHATYDQEQAVVHADGAVGFKKGRLSGVAVGMSYDTNTEVLSLLSTPDVRLEPAEGDGAGSDGMQFRAGSAVLDRVQHLLTLSEAATITRGTQTLGGDEVVARLSDDEQGVSLVELHGHARVEGGGGSVGGMTSRDMTLDYADDGATLEGAVLTGEAGVVVGGNEPGAPRRHFTGGVLNLLFDPGGNVSSATGREGVRIELPDPSGGGGRVVSGREFMARYGPSGLSELRVAEAVEYQEQSGSVQRTAKGRSLTLRVVEDAVAAALFGGGATFVEGALTASADTLDYDLQASRLVLTTGASGVAPRLTDERLSLTAQERIEASLSTKDVQAAGSVKTVLLPTKGESGRSPGLPVILSAEQSVNINADALSSVGDGARMTYTGAATLWQGDTAMRADVLTLDRSGGTLVAAGAARVSLPLTDGPATGRASRIRFEDSSRTLTLETPAQRGRGATSAGMPSYLSVPQGEIRADRIGVVLSPGGRMETDRLEASGQVGLKLGLKTAVADRLTYVARDDRYELTGTASRPVSLGESCRATTGKTLIFYRSTDRILVDGNEELRTQTKGSGACVPATR